MGSLRFLRTAWRCLILPQTPLNQTPPPSPHTQSQPVGEGGGLEMRQPQCDGEVDEVASQ